MRITINDVGKLIKGSKVLIMGLAYKENVPDTRVSPVKEMVKELEDFGVDVYGYDPLLTDEEIDMLGVKAIKDLESVKVDAVIITVAHNVFRKMKLEEIVRMMEDRPVLIDVRGMFDGGEVAKKGVYYEKL